MKCLVIFCFALVTWIPPVFSNDQVPDILIIGNDTIFLKSFPLEALRFKIRPFRYGQYDFPAEDCYRGYQAVWRVVGHKLFLSEIIKADGSYEKIDIIKYFVDNDYIPIVKDGLIFADWFTVDLKTFPRAFKDLGCIWKNKTKKQPATIKFRHGVMTYNRYKEAS